MRLNKFAAPIAASMIFLTGAHAQTMTAESLANCMLENSGENEKTALKNMMIKALSDAPAAELEASTMALGLTIVGLATSNCDMAVGDLTSDMFGDAAELYGMEMGELVMTEAMAKIE